MTEPGTPDLQRLADESAIARMLSQLALLADAGDTDGYIALLADDVVWEMPANAALGLAATRIEGREAIAAGQRHRMANGTQGPGSDTRHVVSTVAIAVQGDEARSEAVFQFFGSTSTQPVLRSMGHYLDEWRRRPDGWRLARRTITFG